MGPPKQLLHSGSVSAHLSLDFLILMWPSEFTDGILCFEKYNLLGTPLRRLRPSRLRVASPKLPVCTTRVVLNVLNLEPEGNAYLSVKPVGVKRNSRVKIERTNPLSSLASTAVSRHPVISLKTSGLFFDPRYVCEA